MLRNLFGVSSGSDSSSDSDRDEGAESSLDLLGGSALEPNLEVLHCPQNPSFRTVRLKQQPSRGIAHQLWPAAKFLCDFLETKLEELVPPETTVIELGAGIGLCGIFLGCVGSRQVIITDLPEALDTINQNIELNDMQASCSAQTLCWGNSEHAETVLAQVTGSTPPLVIAADCVYWECLYKPLFDTLTVLVNRGCVVVIAHVRRWKKDGKFFHMCKKSMAVEVLLEVVDTERDEQCDRTVRRVRRIYKISKLV